MQGKIESNAVLEELDTQQTDYEYNFFNTPWDDRSKKSKIGIVSLLFVVFLATMAIVINNIVIFYNGFRNTSLYTRNEIKCNLIKINKHGYAARIHSIASQEVICVGAMVSTSYVLVNALCLKHGPVRLYLGGLSSPRCKKGFSVEVMQYIPHDGAIKKSLVLLTTSENFIECGDVIKLGLQSTSNRPAFIIGRPNRGGRTLSFQPATLVSVDNLTNNMLLSISNLDKDYLICAKHLLKCPVRPGDLLVQMGRLIGIAPSRASDNGGMACFANLSLISDELRELDVEMELG